MDTRDRIITTTFPLTAAFMNFLCTSVSLGSGVATSTIVGKTTPQIMDSSQGCSQDFLRGGSIFREIETTPTCSGHTHLNYTNVH